MLLLRKAGSERAPSINHAASARSCRRPCLKAPGGSIATLPFDHSLPSATAVLAASAPVTLCLGHHWSPTRSSTGSLRPRTHNKVFHPTGSPSPRARSILMATSRLCPQGCPPPPAPNTESLEPGSLVPPATLWGQKWASLSDQEVVRGKSRPIHPRSSLPPPGRRFAPRKPAPCLLSLAHPRVPQRSPDRSKPLKIDNKNPIPMSINKLME